MKNKNKIWLIVILSVLGVIWLASLTFLGISQLSETATESIQEWYASRNEEKTLNLSKISLYGTLLSTIGIVLVLLFKEIKKRYR